MSQVSLLIALFLSTPSFFCCVLFESDSSENDSCEEFPVSGVMLRMKFSLQQQHASTKGYQMQQHAQRMQVW